MIDEKDRAFWMLIRQALMSMLEAIEIRFNVKPTTSHLRKMYKKELHIE